jgi:hypothetical protein
MVANLKCCWGRSGYRIGSGDVFVTRGVEKLDLGQDKDLPGSATLVTTNVPTRQNKERSSIKFQGLILRNKVRENE